MNTIYTIDNKVITTTYFKNRNKGYYLVVEKDLKDMLNSVPRTNLYCKIMIPFKIGVPSDFITIRNFFIVTEDEVTSQTEYEEIFSHTSSEYFVLELKCSDDDTVMNEKIKDIALYTKLTY